MPTAEIIVCQNCSKPTKAIRVGAQDYCDVYVCTKEPEHIIRIKIDAPRKEWKDENNRVLP